MTSEDVLKFCEKGSHEYSEVDVMRSIKSEQIYLLFVCKKCPSRWVKNI